MSGIGLVHRYIYIYCYYKLLKLSVTELPYFVFFFKIIIEYNTETVQCRRLVNNVGKQNLDNYSLFILDNIQADGGYVNITFPRVFGTVNMEYDCGSS
jgi:hypothetical protein